MKHIIKNRYSGEVIFSFDSHADLRGADLSFADLTDTNLSDADLTDTNLSDANLSYADLRGADLRGADLRGANLRGADLSYADLRGANLRGADLRGANLRGANLSYADLRGANLSFANLSFANLRGADLSDVDLGEARADLLRKLSFVPGEAAGLLAALERGAIDGCSYVGECACFCGTIATALGIPLSDGGKVFKTQTGFAPDSTSGTERLFAGIKPGDTPQNHPIARLVAEWITIFIREAELAGRVK